MVGPGEVDEELEPEVKEECGKYPKKHMAIFMRDLDKFYKDLE